MFKTGKTIRVSDATFRLLRDEAKSLMCSILDLVDSIVEDFFNVEEEEDVDVDEDEDEDVDEDVDEDE